MVEVRPELSVILVQLLQLGAHKAPVYVTTRQLARLTGLSQQTASRRLVALQAGGLVVREATGRGRLVKVSARGLEYLTALHVTLGAALEGPGMVAFRGRVFSGIGDGRYYMGVYRRIFEEKLGFSPFPGTLNLRVSTSEDLKAVQEARMRSAVEIREFSSSNRRFGSGRCAPVVINAVVKGAIVFPQRTHYGPDVVELIAPVSLRESLRLKDGDEVTVEVAG